MYLSRIFDETSVKFMILHEAGQKYADHCFLAVGSLMIENIFEYPIVVFLCLLAYY